MWSTRSEEFNHFLYLFDFRPHLSPLFQILCQSIQVQSSTLPKSGDFEEFVLSNASLSVAALMRTYLTATLGKEQAPEMEVVLGVLLWDPAARDGEHVRPNTLVSLITYDTLCFCPGL